MSNLVLTRRPKESIHITLEDGRVITVTILTFIGLKVRLAISADPTILIDRHEVTQRKALEA